MNRLLRLTVCCILLAAPFLGQGTTPQVVYSEFRPTVIRSDRTQPVLFTAKVSGTPSRVALEVNGLEREMRDDATGGDLTAGDTVYTVSLPPDQIVGKLAADDVFRPFIGFLNIYQLSTRVFRGNIFAEVITSQIPRLPVLSLAPDAQATASLFNIVDPLFVTSGTSDIPRITKKFYEDFSDDFDFIHLVYAVTRFQNRYHFAVRNDVVGTGVGIFDNSSTYGSNGRLQGISVFPISSVFDGAETGYQHEFGHQWINFLSKVPALASGVPHWPISSLASGVMGFSIPPTNQGGTYACILTAEAGGIRLTPRIGSPVFNDLELYLMGLLPPDQVGDHIVFVDQQQAMTQPCAGLFTGPTTTVRISDIVSAVGPRVPGHSVAPKHFRIATIIVSKDGLLSEDEMAFYSFFSSRAVETHEVPYQSGFVKGFAKPFAISTGGRGSLDVGLLDALPTKYSVRPRGGFSMTSAGGNTGEMTVGSGRIVRDAGTSAPSGLAILGLRQNNTLVSEATVPASDPLTAGRIFAETGGRVNTGLAIANPNSQDVSVSFYFTNEFGQNFGAGGTVIPAKGQISRFLDGAPFNGGSPILGTFTFVASAPVVPVAIRGYSTERSEFLMTTLSVIDLALPAVTDTIVLPHFADGGGFTTQFVLVNPRDDTLSGTIQFYSTGSVAPTNAPGIPVAVQIDGQTATSFNFSIPPRSSRRLQTSGGGAAIQSGSVRIVPDPGSATPSVQGIFSYRQGGVMVSEAGIPAIPASTAYRVYVESAGTLGVAGSIQSGLALANPSALPATVVLELTSLTGTPTGNVESLTVPANGQVAMFLGSIGSFASVPTPFQGVLRLSAASPGIFALGLRARYNERGEFLMTTTVPTVESAVAPNVDLFFPHIVDGGGFTTQFILFDGSADQSFSGVLQFSTQSGQRLVLSFP